MVNRAICNSGASRPAGFYFLAGQACVRRGHEPVASLSPEPYRRGSRVGAATEAVTLRAPTSNVELAYFRAGDEGRPLGGREDQHRPGPVIFGVADGDD